MLIHDSAGSTSGFAFEFALGMEVAFASSARQSSKFSVRFVGGWSSGPSWSLLGSSVDDQLLNDKLGRATLLLPVTSFESLAFAKPNENASCELDFGTTPNGDEDVRAAAPVVTSLPNALSRRFFDSAGATALVRLLSRTDGSIRANDFDCDPNVFLPMGNKDEDVFISGIVPCPNTRGFGFDAVSGG